MVQQSQGGQGLRIILALEITLIYITVGRTPLDEWSARRRDLYLTTHNNQNRQTSMFLAGFEPTVPASEWPQTHALDGALTGIGRTNAYSINKWNFYACGSDNWIVFTVKFDIQITTHKCGFGGLEVACWLLAQVRGFKPCRSRQIFRDEKIPSTPSFGGVVKPAVPCRRIAACKRSLNVTWKSAFRQNSRLHFLAH
jgi:hypothetical protein